MVTEPLHSARAAAADSLSQNAPEARRRSLAPSPASGATHQEDVSVSFAENNIIVYRFVDKDTGDLVRQVPPEEILRLVRNINDLLQGQSEEQKTINILS